jgi:hypothetical protein
LRKEIERWIVKDYHQRTHSETGRKPSELWEETVRLRLPESDDALQLLLLKSDKERMVYNTGIKFKFGSSTEETGQWYWAPELAYHVGEKISIRYNPDDSDSILVYGAATKEYICEAWLMGGEESRYTIEDVKHSRSTFKRGLQERLKDYISQIERQDRSRAQEGEWDEARQIARTQEDLPYHAAGVPDSDDLLLDKLLNEFHRQDNGVCHSGNSGEEVE